MNDMQSGLDPNTYMWLVIIIFIFGIASPFVGAFYWRFICIKYEWPFTSGGFDNEPFGGYAIVWGFVSFLPVFLGARLITTAHDFSTTALALKWLISEEAFQVFFLSLFAGLGAMLFYGLVQKSSFRSKLYRGNKKQEPMKEELLISLWSLFVTLSPALFLLLWDIKFSLLNVGTVWLFVYMVPTALSLIACWFFIHNYFSLKFNDRDQDEQVRGVMASLFQRIGVYVGFICVFEPRYLRILASTIMHWIIPD